MRTNNYNRFWFRRNQNKIFENAMNTNVNEKKPAGLKSLSISELLDYVGEKDCHIVAFLDPNFKNPQSAAEESKLVDMIITGELGCTRIIVAGDHDGRFGKIEICPATSPDSIFRDVMPKYEPIAYISKGRTDGKVVACNLDEEIFFNAYLHDDGEVYYVAENFELCKENKVAATTLVTRRRPDAVQEPAKRKIFNK